MFNDVRIETERLVLRPIRPHDDAAFQRILAQPDVMHYLPESVMTIEEVRKIIDWYQMCYEKNTPEKIIKWTLGLWMKDDTDSGLIGWAGVGPVEFDESQTEIFYGLAVEHWGKGYATEAAQAVLDYAINTIGLERIVGIAKEENIASVKVLEKIGLTFERILTGMPEKCANDEGSRFYALNV